MGVGKGEIQHISVRFRQLEKNNYYIYVDVET